MVAAAKRVAEAVLQAITRQWACGDVEWVTQSLERPLRFLGLELAWSTERALLLGQNSYVKELAARYETELAGVKVAEVPLSLGTQEPESEDAALEDLRKCQRLIGEVVWLSVRTRPDISFALSRLSSWMTRSPVKVYQLGLQLLAYVIATEHLGLVFRCQDSTEGRPGFREVDCSCLVEALTDASFAPEASKSQECCVLLAEGCLVGWRTTRQSFMTQSSCEAEFMATATGCAYAQAHVYLLAELCQKPPRVQVFNDNQAAVTVFSGTNTQWRTRSLRIKARTLKERWNMGFFAIYHIEGIYNGADLGTKPLGGQRIRALCSLLGVDNVQPKLRVAKFCFRAERDYKLCLQLVLLACLLAQVQAHTQDHARKEESVWAFWVGFGVLVVCCWEGFKFMCRSVWSWGLGFYRECFLRDPSVMRPIRDEGTAERPEPLSEDMIEDLQGQTERHAEREERLRARRRGQPVANPEPDREPGVQPRRLRYVDDEVDVPEAFEGLRERAYPSDIRQTEAPAVPQQIPVQDFAVVRARAIERNQGAGLLRLDRLVTPMLREDWARPEPILIRDLDRRRSEWGGRMSAVLQLPLDESPRDDFLLQVMRPTVLTRWHSSPRLRLFYPTDARSEFRLSQFTGRRRTLAWFVGAGELQVIDDDFRNPENARRTLRERWVGRTEVEIIVQPVPEAD